MGNLATPSPSEVAATGQRVWLVVLLDRTGSMSPLRQETERAFDHFITEQRAATTEIGDDVRVSLVQFDAYHGGPAVEVVYEDVPLDDVPPLRLEPRGTTPLHDAMGSTIIEVRSHLDRLGADRLPGKVILVTITDGRKTPPGSTPWTR